MAKRVRIRFRHLSFAGGFQGAAAQKSGQPRQIANRRYRAAAFPVLDGFDPDWQKAKRNEKGTMSVS